MCPVWMHTCLLLIRSLISVLAETALIWQLQSKVKAAAVFVFTL